MINNLLDYRFLQVNQFKPKIEQFDVYNAIEVIFEMLTLKAQSKNAELTMDVSQNLVVCADK